MRKTLLILAIAASLMLAPTHLRPSAEAGVLWSIGSAFSVGGFDFALVFGGPYGYFGGPYGESHHYRTHRSLHYRGYDCHGACSYRAGYYYHHPNCSVVRYHFRRHRFSPDRYLRSAPWYYGGSGQYDRYRRDYRHYDRSRHDRYRYDRQRYDRQRYDRYRYNRYRDRDDDSDSDRYNRDRGRRDRSYSDSNRRDHRRDGDYRRDDRRKDDRFDSSRRRGSDTRSRGRGHDD